MRTGSRKGGCQGRVKPKASHEHCLAPGPPLPPTADKKQHDQYARKKQDDFGFLSYNGIAFAARLVAMAG